MLDFDRASLDPSPAVCHMRQQRHPAKIVARKPHFTCGYVNVNAGDVVLEVQKLVGPALSDNQQEQAGKIWRITSIKSFKGEGGNFKFDAKKHLELTAVTCRYLRDL